MPVKPDEDHPYRNRVHEVIRTLYRSGEKRLAHAYARSVGLRITTANIKQLETLHGQMDRTLQKIQKLVVKMKDDDMMAAYKKLDRALDDLGSEIEIAS